MKSKFRFSALLAAIILFLFFGPYFFWWGLKTDYVAIFLKFVLFILFALNLEIKSNGRMSLFCLFLGLLIFIPISRGQNLFAVIYYTMLCTVPFGNRQFSDKVFDYFLSIYAVFMTISSFVYLLFLIHLAPQIGVLESLNELKMHNYLVYPLMVVPNETSGFIVTRFCGLFDEPGVVGTLSAFLLVIGKFNLKDKRLFSVLITGILSFSFFFYIIAFIYYFIYRISISVNKRTSFFLILTMIVVCIVTYNIDFFYDAIWSRFMWDESRGSIVGDNRINQASKDFFASIVGTGEFYFGVTDYEYFSDLSSGGFSIIMPMVQFGVLAVAVYFIIFIRYAWNYKQSIIPFGLFVFVFVGTLYQRPSLFTPDFLFMFSMMAVTCRDNIVVTNNTAYAQA